MRLIKQLYKLDKNDKDFVMFKFGGVRKCAKKLGLSASYVSDLLNGRRTANKQIVKSMGLYDKTDDITLADLYSVLTGGTPVDVIVNGKRVDNDIDFYDEVVDIISIENGRVRIYITTEE